MESIKDKIHVIYEKYSKKPVNTLKRVVALMMAVFLAFSSYTGNWSVLGQKVYADDGEAETKSVDITIDGIPDNIKDEELTQGSFLLENAGRMYTGETVNIQQDTESKTKEYTVTFKGIDEADVKADGANPVIDFYKENAEQTTYYEGWKGNVNDELKVEIPVDKASNTVKYDNYKKVDITINDSDNIGLEASDFAVAVKKPDPDNTNVSTCILSEVNKTSLVYSALVKNPKNEEYTVDVTINGQSQSAGNFEIDESSTYGTLTIRENAEKNITGNCIVKRKNADADYIITVTDETGKTINDASVKLSYKTSDGEDNEVTTTNNGNGTYTASIKKGVLYKTGVEYNNYIQVDNKDYEKKTLNETVKMKKKTYKIKVNDNQNVSLKVTDNDDANGNSNVNDQSLEFGKNYKVEISSTVKNISGVSAKCNDKEVCSDTKIENNKWTGILNISDSQPDEYNNDMEIIFNVTTSDGKIIIDDSTEVDNYNANSTMSIKSEPEAKSWKIEQDKGEDNYEEITGNYAVIKIDTAGNKLTISPQAKADNKYKITAYADDNKKEAIASKEITISDYEQISLDNKNNYYKVVNDNNKEDVVNVTDNNTDIYYSASDVKIIAQKNAFYKWVPDNDNNSSYEKIDYTKKENGNEIVQLKNTDEHIIGTLYIYEENATGIHESIVKIVFDTAAPKITAEITDKDNWTQSKTINLTVSDNLSSSITDDAILNNSIYYVTGKTDISFLKNGDTYKNYYSLDDSDKKTINSLSKLKLNKSLNQSLNASLEVTENGTIHFIAIDKVGNISVEDFTVDHIDRTKPIVTVEYFDLDNNAIDNINENTRKYINKGVKVKVTVDDYNFTDNSKYEYSDAEYFTLGVTKNGTTTDEALVFTKNTDEASKRIAADGKEYYTWSAEYNLTEDADYSINVSKCMDRAGNVFDGSTVKTAQITVDKTEPQISITYDNNNPSNTIDNYGYYNAARTATIKIEELSFDNSNTKVILTKNGEKVDITSDFKGNSEYSTRDNRDSYKTYEMKYLFKDDADYTITVESTDKAVNQSDKTDKFTVDKTKPQISIKYKNEALNKSVTQYTDKKNRTYKIFSMPIMDVVVEVSDNLSGIQSITKDGVKVEFTNNGNTATYISPIEADFKGTIEFTATDNSNNSTTKTTEGIVVESEKKHNDKETSSVTINPDNVNGKNGFYNKDFNVKFNAKDSYSYIKSIVYKIGDTEYTVDGTETNKFADSDVESWGNEVTIEAGKHNSNAFPVSITMTDNAGHKTEASMSYKIDTISPKVTLEYYDADGNKIEDLNENTRKYINKGVKVKVTVDDYNFADNSKDEYSDADYFTLGVTKNGTTTDEALVFTKNTDEASKRTSADQTAYYTWSAEYNLTEDADYSINVSKCMDRAGNVFDGSTVKTAQITVDKTEPQISITYDNNNPSNTIDNYGYYNAARTATIKIEELSFDNSNTKVILTKNGEKVDITSDFKGNSEYSTRDNRDSYKTYEMKYLFKDDADYTITVESTDKAVNQDKYDKIDKFTVDKTAPNISITYDKNEPSTFNNHDYYKTARTATIKIEELSFDNSNTKVILTKNGKKVDITSDFKEKSGYNKRGNDTGDSYKTYEMKYTFNDDADYTITVTSVDYAKNQGKYDGTDKFTIDKTAPDISVVYDSQAPANNYNNHDYYNVEKTVTITVKDLSFSADKDKVKVMLKKDGVDTQLASDFKEIAGYTTWENSNDTYKTYQMTYVIKDDADYAFTVECTDLAGNEDKYDRVDYFTIDKTSPVINVEYDNNTPLNIYDGHNYYNEQRTATITIDELSFNNDDVKVLVTKNNQTVAVQPDFNQIAGYTTRADSGDTYNTYQMTYAFDTDGDYTITVEYTDLAKNVDTYDRTDNFTVDMNGADIYVTYDNNQPSNTVDGYDYYNVTRTATVTIEELSFRNEDAHVIVTKNGNAVQVTPQFTETAGYQVRGNGNSYRTYQMTYLIDGDGDYTFTVDYTDLAGNADTYDRTDSFTIDKTRPEIRVTYDTDSPSNTFNNHDYYNVTRQATIAIDELSFNNSDVNVIVTKNNETVIVTPSFEEVTGLQTKDNGDTYRTYQMIYPFTEDADYTITVDYTDLAANTDEYDRTDSFTIDRSRPEIEVTYDNNTPSNSEGGKDYYNTQRTATVTVRELSFNNDDVQFIVTRDGASTVESPAFTEVAGLQTKDNGDTYRTYEMTYTFNDNFDYTVTADYTDLAGNSDNYDNVDEFTYDDIKPVISIELTGTSLESNEYFNDSRTATITVEEHNFNEAEFQLHMTATDNGTEIAAPSISGFAANGDTHTATIVFDRDEEITISADYTDMAGNVADTLNEQKFVIDLTDPEIEIEQDSLIENKTYGKDEAAMPKILITDTNFSQNGVSIQLEGRKNGLIQAAVASETVPNGLLYTVSGIDEDDVYTLTVNVTDMSGREQQYTRQFHVNRNGSSYAFGNALQTMNKTYVKAVGEDLYIVETNVDALTANKVTYSRGGMIAELKPETDYTVAVAENAYGWQEYTYRISQKVFSEEGEYKVILSSTDTAGNNSDNSSKEQAISFVVDNTPPTQVITGVEDDGVYTQDSLDVTIEVYDNVAVNSVDITLNGVKTTYNEEQITKENGKVYVNIPSDTKKQTLEVACIDYAGNEAQHQTYSFTVSTNAFIAFKARYLSKPDFWVAVGCVAVALAGAVTGTVVIRRRKKNVADN